MVTGSLVYAALRRLLKLMNARVGIWMSAGLTACLVVLLTLQIKYGFILFIYLFPPVMHS